MKVQDENKLYDDINITPMLDLAYVLLRKDLALILHYHQENFSQKKKF